MVVEAQGKETHRPNEQIQRKPMARLQDFP